MKYLNDSGLLYLWQKIKEKLSGKVDKVEGKGLSTNDYTASDKIKVDKIITNGDGSKFLSNNGTYETVQTDLSAYATNNSVDIKVKGAKDYADKLNTAMDTRVTALESLGQYVGTFDTYAKVPNNVSGFDNITINDFINVRVDENHQNRTTRYIATAIDGTTGTITWTYDITYTTDVSGKMDKQAVAKKDNIAVFDNAGQAVDSGKKLADYYLKSDIVAITNEEIDQIIAS